MPNCCLGIDTSNYKTSVAVVDENNSIVFRKSEFLEVEHGKRGLRQSVAFFKHVQVLPSFIEEALATVGREKISAVAVSDRPRRREDSYMPVFSAGVQAAHILSTALGVPCYTCSHQEGHIEAVLHSFPSAAPRVLFFHLSGGTTECLLAERQGCHIETEIVGGSRDISVGQLLDRTGVALGFPFPSGGYLDKIACTAPHEELVGKIRSTEGYFNLSGTETQVLRSIEEKGEGVVPSLFRQIDVLLTETAEFLADRYGVREVYFAGGVASSEFLRRRNEARGTARRTEIFFGEKALSGDNAVGIALLGGREHHETRQRITGQ